MMRSTRQKRRDETGSARANRVHSDSAESVKPQKLPQELLIVFSAVKIARVVQHQLLIC